MHVLRERHLTVDAGAAQPAGWSARLRSAAVLEDALLLGWLATVGPWLAGAQRGSGEPVSATTIAVGLAELGAIVGALACILTRGRGDPPMPDDPGASGRSFAPYPLAFALSVIGREAFDALGIVSEAVAALAFLAAGIGTMARGRLPELSPAVRRILITPYLLVSASVFQGFVGDMWRGTGTGLAFWTDAGGGPGLGILSIVILGTAVFYLAFIAAPRELVEAPRPAWVWPIRFAIFVLGLIFGIGLPVVFG